MRSALTFAFHLVLAILAVPMLALISAGMVYPIVRHWASSAQQFYSDHLFILLAFSGLWLAYAVCDTFTRKFAAWVWIPALLVFALRVAMWRSEGSVLIHRSVVEHFFTADCQIQNWRDINFGFHCSDRLLLMQVVVAPFGYSAGAAIHHFVQRQRRSAVVSSS